SVNIFRDSLDAVNGDLNAVDHTLLKAKEYKALKPEQVAQVRDQVEQLARQQDQELENQVAVLRQEDQDNAEALVEHLEKMLERKRITNQRRLVAKR
ncbi:MAG: hypothetical protein ACKO2M_03220, partial [Actinomycetota bacterium]